MSENLKERSSGSQESVIRSDLLTEPFAIGDLVTISNRASPFYGWSGRVVELVEQRPGRPRWSTYHSQYRFRVECQWQDGPLLSPVFSDGELTKVGVTFS